MKKIFLISFVIALVGCSSASPEFINGHYYLTGDKSCKVWIEKKSDTIDCYDSEETHMGHRDAMTDQQLQMFMHKELMNRSTSCYRNRGFTRCY